MDKNAENYKTKKLEDLLIVLVKYRKIIIINVIIVTLATALFSLFIPNKYTSTASFISPKGGSGLLGDLSGFSSTLKDLSKTLGGRIGAMSDEAYNYLVILQSRSASERVIEKFNLRKVYEIGRNKPIENVISELRSNVDFTIEDEGNIVVSVTDKNPRRAANIANYYVAILNEYSAKLSTTEARNNREFIGRRLADVKSTISNIEDSLENFSKKYNVLKIEDQLKAEISAAAELKAQVEITKIERDLLKNNYGENSPLVEQANIKLNELNKRLTDLNLGGDKNLNSNLNFFIPFKNIPSIGMNYIKLKRDYEIQSKILEFIYPFYEQAKIQEQKDIPVVLVVDKAVPPQKKSSPKRSLIVIAAFLLSLFISIGYVLILDSYSSLKEDKVRFQKIREGILDPLNLRKKNKE